MRTALLAALLLVPAPSRTAESAGLQERHTLFTLAILALTHSNLVKGSTAGHAISAAVAWDVEDMTRTPEFILDFNRNLEIQSEIQHAEVVALNSAWAKKLKPYPAGISNEEKRESYRGRLTNATVYTTLEPCPMCASTAFMSRVPKVFFALEDTAFRDPKTHKLLHPTVQTFYGRTLEQIPLRHPVIDAMNGMLWKAEAQARAGKITAGYVMKNRDGAPRLNLISYLHDEGKTLFAAGAEAFRTYQVQNKANQALHRALLDAVQR